MAGWLRWVVAAIAALLMVGLLHWVATTPEWVTQTTARRVRVGQRSSSRSR